MKDHPSDQRKPRAYWERKLETLLAGITAEPKRVYPWREKWQWPPPAYHDGVFIVSEVHVFGSFARGAAECGDLDILVVIVASKGARPSSSTVKKLLFGRPQRVQVFVDYQDTDTYRKHFPEHRLVWSQTSPDLKANLAGLGIVAGAGRFARKTDALPFPLEAFRAMRNEGEELVDAIEAGEVTSTVIPLESVAVDRDRWSSHQQHIARIFVEEAGAKTRQLAFPVLQYVFDTATSEPYYWHGSDRSHIHVNGVAAWVGRCALADWMLDRLDTTTVVLVPHQSRRWKTAIWKLERGPEHGAFKQFKDVQLWCLVQGKKPLYIPSTTGMDTYVHEELGSLRTYGTERDAKSAAKVWSTATRTQVEVVRAQGRQLCTWICQSNQIMVNDWQVCNSHDITDFRNLLEEALARPVCTFEPPRICSSVFDREPYTLSPTRKKGVYRMDQRGGHVIHARIKQRRTGRLVELLAPLEKVADANAASEVLFIEKHRLQRYG